jgi:hypothetical protein
LCSQNIRSSTGGSVVPTAHLMVFDGTPGTRRRRVEGISKSPAASREAKMVVGELHQRLASEIEEREVEAAVYSAKLYESEKVLGDWYVEKRLLEEQLAQLHAELAERDRMDGEVERCFCSLYERIQSLDAENAQLRAAAAAEARQPA